MISVHFTVYNTINIYLYYEQSEVNHFFVVDKGRLRISCTGTRAATMAIGTFCFFESLPLIHIDVLMDPGEVTH